MENEIFIEINGGFFKDNTYKNEDILENNLFDFRPINITGDTLPFLYIISLQNELILTKNKEYETSLDILYLSINFN